jgi:FtsP/CotA-like multicopper oxidase with cupredoxin domain
MGAEHPHAASTSLQRHDHPMGPGVAGVAESPTNRLGEPGAGLEDVPHRVLVYTDLVSLEPNPDTRAPERELELHLTSNMERYMWSFDGRKLSEVVEPIVFQENERLRLTMVNDTMMPHPIHLHGMFFDVVTGQSGHESQSGHEGQTEHKPRKHTLVIKPGEKCSVDITADAVGDWAFHCHLLYHMQAGMFRVVSVRPRAGGQEHEHHHHG